MRHRAAPAALAAYAAIGLLLFARILRVPFLSDDFKMLIIVQRAHGPLVIFEPLVGRFIRPLVVLLYYVNFKAFGLNPLPYHLVLVLVGIPERLADVSARPARPRGTDAAGHRVLLGPPVPGLRRALRGRVLGRPGRPIRSWSPSCSVRCCVSRGAWKRNRRGDGSRQGGDSSPAACWPRKWARCCPGWPSAMDAFTPGGGDWKKGLTRPPPSSPRSPSSSSRPTSCCGRRSSATRSAPTPSWDRRGASTSRWSAPSSSVQICRTMLAPGLVADLPRDGSPGRVRRGDRGRGVPGTDAELARDPVRAGRRGHRARAGRPALDRDRQHRERALRLRRECVLVHP